MANQEKFKIVTKAISIISGAVFTGVAVSIAFRNNPNLRNQVEEQIRSILSVAQALIGQYSAVVQKVQEISAVTKNAKKNSNYDDADDLLSSLAIEESRGAYNQQWDNL